jgi:putative CocE/NonD family hydrolase
VEAWLAECEKNVWDWFKKPLSRQIEIFRDVPMTQRYYQDMVEHSDFDDYWKDTGYNVEGFYEKFPDIPIHYFGGWFDALIRGTIKNYVELSKIHKSPTLLTIGPWCHGPVSAKLTWQGDVDFGPDSAVDWNEDRLQLYDQVAKGKDTGLFEEPRVRVFVMGGGDGRRNMAGRMNHGGRWLLEKAWPLPQTKFTKHYLHSDGSLGPDLPGRDAPPRRYSFDPAHPVPQIGGGYTCPWLGRGGLEEAVPMIVCREISWPASIVERPVCQPCPAGCPNYIPSVGKILKWWARSRLIFGLRLQRSSDSGETLDVIRRIGYQWICLYLIDSILVPLMSF